MTPPSGDLSQTIAHHVATAHFESLPEEAVAATKRSLLDALGVMLAASGMGEGCKAFVDLARHDGGVPTSTIIGFGDRVPPGAAAMANGSMAHALDFEDAHDRALVHPNAATIPAVLALAEERGATGAEVLTAIAVGCDLVCRLGLALRDDPARFGWYPPPILQAFGAAAGAARILKLDPETTLDALSITLAQVTGTSQMTHGARSVIRGVRDAFGASAGVLAARLAESGVAGFDAPFEGEAGLYALYAEGRFEPSELTDELGLRYEGANVAFKPWPSCRGTHAAIAAVLELRADGLHADDLGGEGAEIVVEGAALNRMLCEPEEQRRRPRTAIDAKFSLPFTIGWALVHGGVDLPAFEPQALQDPAVLAVADRVQYRIDPDDSPGAATRCRLLVTTDDGRHIEQMQVAPGGTEAPLSNQVLQEKFRANAQLAVAPLGEAQIKGVIEAVDGLERSAHVGLDLMALLAG